eukprot:scpid35373/ scgid23499/ 
MEMINFDEHKEKPTKHHYLLPDCHYMMIGQTGCGKTNTLCNMLLQSWLNCDKVILYTINPQQPKYQLLDGFYNGISPGNLIIEQPDKVCPVEDLDDQENKVIIFDDIKIDKKNMTKVMEYFSLSRNKKCNCIYLCQSYYDVPKYIRRNTKCFLLYKGLDNRDVQCLAHDHSKNLKKTEFAEAYEMATEKPHSFFMLDKTATYQPEMYRCGFDRFLEK